MYASTQPVAKGYATACMCQCNRLLRPMQAVAFLLFYLAVLGKLLHVFRRLHTHFFLEAAAEVAGVVIAHGIGQLGYADVLLLFHDAAGCLHADIAHK